VIKLKSIARVFDMKIIFLVVLLSSLSISSQDCLNYKEVKSTYKFAAPIYAAVGVLKSNSCNNSEFAEGKGEIFFQKILTPGMVEDVNNGKYPKRCSFVITDAINAFHDDMKNKTHKSSVCKDAKSLLEMF